MSDDPASLPAFGRRLELLPGHEPVCFRARLLQIIELREEIDYAGWCERWGTLAGLCAAHGRGADATDFAHILEAAERVPQTDETKTDYSSGSRPVTFIETNGEAEGTGPSGLISLTTFYGPCSDEDAKKLSVWQSQPHIKRLYRLVVDASRRLGCVNVPPHWTPSTSATLIGNGLWNVMIRDGLALYNGLATDRYCDLLDCAAAIFAVPPPAWLVRPYSTIEDWLEVLESVASMVWDATDDYHIQGMFAETVDALRVLNFVGPGHPRLERALSECLASCNTAVRRAAAELLQVGMSDELLSIAAERVCVEEVYAVLEHLVRALRLRGGHDGFEALVRAARDARSPYARVAATRALAWVPRCHERHQRLAALARSRDRRISHLAMKAMAEAKYHGLFSRGVQLASSNERRLFTAVKDFVANRGEQAAAELDMAFKTGSLRVEVDGNIGALGCRVVFVTDEEVPLAVELERTRELCGTLNLIPSVEIPNAQMSEEEIRREGLLNRALGSLAMEFQDVQRRKVAEALTLLSDRDRNTFAAMVKWYWSIEKKEDQPTRHVVFSLDSEQHQLAVLLLLEAMPRAARAAENIFVKGPESGRLERVDAFLERCPSVQTYWGYVGDFPSDASEHLEAWLNMKDRANLFERQELAGLADSYNVVLWSRTKGYQPPPSYRERDEDRSS